MNETDKLVIGTSLRSMFEKGYVSICTIDQCLKVAGLIAPRAPYERLSALHCVHFKDMPRELVDRIPTLISECFDQGIEIEQLIKAVEPAATLPGASIINKLLGRKP